MASVEFFQQDLQFLDSLKNYNMSKLIRHLHISGAISEDEARKFVRAKKDGTVANLKVLLTTDRRHSVLTTIVKFVRNASSDFEKAIHAYTSPAHPKACTTAVNQEVDSVFQPTLNFADNQLLCVPSRQKLNSTSTNDDSSDSSSTSGMDVDHPEVYTMSQNCFQENNPDDRGTLMLYNPIATADSGFATQDPMIYSQQSQPMINLVVHNNQTNITIHQSKSSFSAPRQTLIQPTQPLQEQGHSELSPTVMTHQDEVFRNCKPHFLKLINIQTLEPLLLAEGWLTHHESQQFGLHCHTSAQKNEVLFNIIPSKSSNYVEEFVKILRREDQHKGHFLLADILTNCYSRKGCQAPT